LSRDLDTVLFLQFITIYYLDCSFFWFMFRTLVQLTLLTPLPDLALARQHDEHKAFLPLTLFIFFTNFVLHLTFPAPIAGEDTRGYLHGGLMIDFVGQQGPSSKIQLASLDLCVLVLQLVMVSLHVKKRELKKRSDVGGRQQRNAQGVDTQPHTVSEQDADSEERGILRPTDSDIDVGLTDEDSLYQTDVHDASSSGTDLLDALASGQAVIADLYPVSSLRQEHRNYQAYRQSLGESGTASSLSPSTLRQLHSIRVRFGVGGG
jgi:hypothetical protein